MARRRLELRRQPDCAAVVLSRKPGPDLGTGRVPPRHGRPRRVGCSASCGRASAPPWSLPIVDWRNNSPGVGAHSLAALLALRLLQRTPIAGAAEAAP